MPKKIQDVKEDSACQVRLWMSRKIVTMHVKENDEFQERIFCLSGRFRANDTFPLRNSPQIPGPQKWAHTSWPQLLRGLLDQNSPSLKPNQWIHADKNSSSNTKAPTCKRLSPEHYQRCLSAVPISIQNVSYCSEARLNICFKVKAYCYFDKRPRWSLPPSGGSSMSAKVQIPPNGAVI